MVLIFKRININNFDISIASDMEKIFYKCSILKEMNYSNSIINKRTNIFTYTEKLKNKFKRKNIYYNYSNINIFIFIISIFFFYIFRLMKYINK